MLPADNSHEKDRDDNAKRNTVQSKKDNRFSRKAYQMSAFLSIIFLVVVGIVAGIAISNWQKGSYWAAFFWGLAAYLLFGVGIFFTYYSYVIIPARQATPTERPDLFFVQIKTESFRVGEPIVCWAAIKNGGRIAAHNISLVPNIALQLSTFDGPLKYHAGADEDVHPNLSPSAEHIILCNSGDIVMTQERIDAVISGRAQVFFYGKGRYEDETGREYTIDFCALYQPTIPQAMSMCPMKYWPKAKENEQSA